MPAVYAIELVSHRHLRYASGALHVVLLGTNIALVGEGPLYQAALAAQAAWLALAAAGLGIVLHNPMLSGLAGALLIISLARPAAEPE